MVRVKKKEMAPADEHWAEYFAIQLTPEQKAEGWAELERKVEQARRDGVYEHVAELAGKVKWSRWWYDLRTEE